MISLIILFEMKYGFVAMTRIRMAAISMLCRLQDSSIISLPIANASLSQVIKETPPWVLSLFTTIIIHEQVKE